jgi:hypothetical protein
VARLLLAASLTAAWQVAAPPAQQSRPAIIVADPMRIAPAVEAPVLIQLAPPEAVPRGSFIRLRGLPATAALSDGHSIAPGAWSVPVRALATLKILLPEKAAGRSEISITLVSGDGAVLAEAKATLVVGAPPSLSAAASAAPLPRVGPAPTQRSAPEIPPAAPPSPPVALPAPQLTPEARERAMRLVKKGHEQLADGGIAQARLLYERAAESGLALGAMAMAATYDAVELERMGARGLKPDREAARRWYERARQLGAAEAEARLRRLGTN